MKRGLIPTQIGFAEKVHPEGEIILAWQRAIYDQVERDERRLYAETEDRPLVSELPYKKPDRLSLALLIKNLLSV